MRAIDLAILINQSLRVEQMQQTAANQVAAQQQAAQIQVERARVEVATRPERAEPREGESEVFNDERQKGRDREGPQSPRRPRQKSSNQSDSRRSVLDRLV